MTKAERYALFIQNAEVLHALESSTPQPATACDPECPGWAVFETNREPVIEVERCDACDRFPDDDHAIEHVLRQVFTAIDCGNAECMLCRKRLAGCCDCGACEDCIPVACRYCGADTNGCGVCDDCERKNT